MCVGYTSIVAAFLFRNPEAGIVLLLQAALLAMLGCIVRPFEPEEFYNEGQQDNVQNSQLSGVITGWIGAFAVLIVVMFKQEVPTPIEYAVSLYSSITRKDEAEEDVGKDEEPVDNA